MLKIAVETKTPRQLTGQALVVPFLDNKLLEHNLLKPLYQKLPQLAKWLKDSGYKGKPGSVKTVATMGALNFSQVIVVGLGEKKKLKLEELRKAAALTAKEAQSHQVKKLVSALSLVELEDCTTQDIGQVLTEGSQLALYRFEKFKGKKGEKGSLNQIQFVVSGAKSQRDFRAGIKIGDVGSEGALLARDLVNAPPHHMTPLTLAKEAKKLKGIRTRVFDHRQIKKMGMGALYGVGMGSNNPPVLIEMHYKPKGRVKKSVALVGKGITFDSGGLSLKPPQFMETMKDDMAGSASVIATMGALAKLKPNVEVWGYVASAENMPGGKAQRPGDVVKAYNGKTIEVLNTDAEGRLALADALSYLGKHRKVDYIIDIATLTGAALVALGELITAAIGTDQKLVDQLKTAGDFTGEKLWQLPLAEEYWEGFKSEVADMKNIGGKFAGTINGALFLKNFIPEKAKWVHLDIAGPSWAYKPTAYHAVGGTGVMVRTFLRFLSEL